jgi:hypothetical protein
MVMRMWSPPSAAVADGMRRKWYGRSAPPPRPSLLRLASHNTRCPSSSTNAPVHRSTALPPPISPFVSAFSQVSALLILWRHYPGPQIGPHCPSSCLLTLCLLYEYPLDFPLYHHRPLSRLLSPAILSARSLVLMRVRRILQQDDHSRLAWRARVECGIGSRRFDLPLRLWW